MRITATDIYEEEDGMDCEVMDNCERAYCPAHRLLYRTCETAVESLEGDRDVVNGLHVVMDISGDCPACKKDSEKKQNDKLVKEWELKTQRSLP